MASTDPTVPSNLDPDRALSLERAEQMLKSIKIPPRPAILVDLLNEQAKPDVDIKRIAEMVGSDVAISAGTLKIVNSPFFGLRRKIGSVQHAVRLLGVNNTVKVVTGLMLRSAFSGSRGRFMDSFWDWSNRIAMMSALVAQKCTSIPPEEAYTMGLFADCGVPLLLERYPNYPLVFRDAQSVAGETMPTYEDAQLGTDHTVVGYLIGRSWQLPDEFCQCIMRHHDAEDYYSTLHEPMQEATPNLAVLMLAQHLNRKLNGWPVSHEWQAVGEAVQRFLGLGAVQRAQLEQEAAELQASVGDVAAS